MQQSESRLGSTTDVQKSHFTTDDFGPEKILDADKLNAEMTRFQAFSHSTTQVHEENPILTFCWMMWCHFNIMSAPKTTEIIRRKLLLLFHVVSMFVKVGEDCVDHPRGDRFVRSPVVTQDSLLYGPTSMHPFIAVRKSAWHSSSGFLASTLLSSNLSDLCRLHIHHLWPWHTDHSSSAGTSSFSF